MLHGGGTPIHQVDVMAGGNKTLFIGSFLSFFKK
jgi:hypothetical protein